MISYCIVAYRPIYAKLLVEDLIRKTSCPYEILVWSNVGDPDFLAFLNSKKAQGAPIEIVGVTPHNIGMEGFRHLFPRAKYDIITQLDDDVVCISRKIGEMATAMFQRHPSVGQIAADVWQDGYTNGARPEMSRYRQVNAVDGLYDGPIDGWFSMYRKSLLSTLMKAPFAKYAYIGSWFRGVMMSMGKLGVLCDKFKVFHVIGPHYASAFGMLDFEIAKYQGLNRADLADVYVKARATLPPAPVLEAARRVVFDTLDRFGADMKISVITPTIGRDSLRTMLDALVPQLEDGDEAIIVGDGPQPNAQRIVESYRNSRLIYLEQGPIRNYGNPQRNLAIKMAKGDYLFFVDDDDVPLKDCVKGVKAIASRNPGRPFMFRMYHGPGLLWETNEIRGGNISGQMFIPPNKPELLGEWSGKYAADYDFITSTLAKYPEGALMWRGEIVVHQGCAGPSQNAREL